MLCDFLRTQSRRGIVRSALSVKEWAAELPSVAEVRPKRCPGCQSDGRAYRKEVKASVAKRKRNFSPKGIERIRVAARKRWAKYHKAKRAAATG